MNTYDIAGRNDTATVNDIIAGRRFLNRILQYKNILFKITSTSTLTGDLSAPAVYTKDEVLRIRRNSSII